MKEAQEKLIGVVKNASKVIQGKNEKIQLILATWLAGGHVLIEDVPGTGKTVLAKALSKSVSTPMGRVQFTPDLLPGDITGSSIYDQSNHQFKFEKGPVFCGFFLADEINRATPRTQSALLECMSEGQITVDGKTYELDESFIVLATQNPIEHHGTFPLPEAQLDRFSIKTSLGYMNRDQEIKMARLHMAGDPFESINPVMSKEDFLKIRSMISKVKVEDAIYEYVLDIIEKTRKMKELEVGGSPRATLTLLNIARAMALVNGEDFVRPVYVYNLVEPVLAHRLVLTQEAKFSGVTTNKVLESILKSVRPPTK